MTSIPKTHNIIVVGAGWAGQGVCEALGAETPPNTVVTCIDVNGAPSSESEITETRPSTPIALLDAYANFPDGCTTKAAHVDLGRVGGAFTEVGG